MKNKQTTNNEIVIRFGDLSLIANEAGKITLNNQAEKYLVDLLKLKDKVEETLELCKVKVKEAMEALDGDLVSVNTDNLRVMNKIYGSKYNLDTSLIQYIDEKFYTVKQSYSLNSQKVNKHLKETGSIPNGISINQREKTVSISLKNKKENEEI